MLDNISKYYKIACENSKEILNAAAVVCLASAVHGYNRNHLGQAVCSLIAAPMFAMMAATSEKELSGPIRTAAVIGAGSLATTSLAAITLLKVDSLIKEINGVGNALPAAYLLCVVNDILHRR